MFPYARDNVRKHLTSTFDSEETKEDIKLLHIQVSNEVFPIIEASNGIFFSRIRRRTAVFWFAL
jgi:hypothetical protein